MCFSRCHNNTHVCLLASFHSYNTITGLGLLIPVAVAVKRVTMICIHHPALRLNDVKKEDKERRQRKKERR
jgi:hypothetical protein